MREYTFRARNGDLVTVKARDEEEARSKAMEERWGPPTGMYRPRYRGMGLDLVNVGGS